MKGGKKKEHSVSEWCQGIMRMGGELAFMFARVWVGGGDSL